MPNQSGEWVMSMMLSGDREFSKLQRSGMTPDTDPGWVHYAYSLDDVTRRAVDAFHI